VLYLRLLPHPYGEIRDFPILILDEPTAALDTESERLVIEAPERLMKGRTVLTIAHRLSTIRDVDKIIVLKAGVVVPGTEPLRNRACER
jgi:ABC-type multidrug transport system fused ATPase/permease subunit